MNNITKIGISVMTSLFVLVGCNDEEPFIKVESDEEMKIEEQRDNEKIQLATIFIEELSNGEFEQATEKFDDKMREQLGKEDVEQLWGSLEEQLGTYVDHEYDRTEAVDGDEVILINGIFEDAEAMFQVTVSEEEKIVGFYIQ